MMTISIQMIMNDYVNNTEARKSDVTSQIIELLFIVINCIKSIFIFWCFFLSLNITTLFLNMDLIYKEKAAYYI